ncbi:tRNA CCA-pyrophosphorylase, partial [Francisella tularensis subsp. holarctica]|nr:tRNA CCA-pyrophosphorylase [Francisella tularensis subsp. holarctica]
MKFYLVGGAVRDMLLGITPKDKDWVVVGATEDEMLANGFIKIAANFPV